LNNTYIKKMKSNKVNHQISNSTQSPYPLYNKSHNHIRHNHMTKRNNYGRFSLAPKCVTTVVTKTTTEPPLLLSNNHLFNKLDPVKYPLANLKTSLKRFCYDNNGVPTYKKTVNIFNIVILTKLIVK